MISDDVETTSSKPQRVKIYTKEKNNIQVKNSYDILQSKRTLKEQHYALQSLII